MKSVTIQFTFEDYKLEALKFFLEGKGESLEDSLSAHTESLYHKYVPAQVREYLEKTNEKNASKGQRSASGKTKRNSDTLKQE